MNIRTLRFLAYSMQCLAAHDLLEFLEILTLGELYFKPVWLSLYLFGCQGLTSPSENGWAALRTYLLYYTMNGETFHNLIYSAMMGLR